MELIIVLQLGYKRRYSLVNGLEGEDEDEAAITFTWQIFKNPEAWAWISNVGIVTPPGSPKYHALGFDFPDLREWVGEVGPCPTVNASFSCPIAFALMLALQIAPILASSPSSPVLSHHAEELALPSPRHSEPEGSTPHPGASDMASFSPKSSPLPESHEPTSDGSPSNAEEVRDGDGALDDEPPATSEPVLVKVIGKRARQEASSESEKADRPPPRRIRGLVTPPIVPEYDIDRLEEIGRRQSSTVTKV